MYSESSAAHICTPRAVVYGYEPHVTIRKGFMKFAMGVSCYSNHASHLHPKVITHANFGIHPLKQMTTTTIRRRRRYKYTESTVDSLNASHLIGTATQASKTVLPYATFLHASSFH